MTQQAIDGQPSGAQDATDPTAAGGQSTDQGAQQQAVNPATSDGGTVRTVPLATYTQATQARAKIAQRLGISKNAGEDEFLAAFDAALARPAPSADDEDTGELDPATLARIRELDEREWGVARREFGEQVVDAAQEFFDAIRTKRSPYAIAAAFNLAVTEVAAAMNGAGPAPEAGGAQPDGDGTPEVPDLGTLPRGGSSGEIDPRDHRSDTEGFLARLYAKAGIPQRGASGR